MLARIDRQTDGGGRCNISRPRVYGAVGDNKNRSTHLSQAPIIKCSFNLDPLLIAYRYVLDLLPKCESHLKTHVQILPINLYVQWSLPLKDHPFCHYGRAHPVLTLATRMFVINEKLFLFAIVDRYPFASCAKDIFVEPTRPYEARIQWTKWQILFDTRKWHFAGCLGCARTLGAWSDDKRLISQLESVFNLKAISLLCGVLKHGRSLAGTRTPQKACVFVDACRRVKRFHRRVFINLNPSIYHVIRVHKIKWDKTWKDLLF